MKLFVLGLALLLGSASTVEAADPWSKTDVALQVVYTALHVVDWGQTRWISKNPVVVEQTTTKEGRGTYTTGTAYSYREINPLLGERPSSTKINFYFATTLVGHAVITHFLPAKYRTVWQATTISVEGYFVGKNIKAGINFDF